MSPGRTPAPTGKSVRCRISRSSIPKPLRRHRNEERGAAKCPRNANDDRSGKTRIRCSAFAESRSCPDPHTYYVETIETATLNGLRGELRDPQLIAEYVRTYSAERQAIARKATVGRAQLETRLAGLDQQLRRQTVLYAEEEDHDRRARLGDYLDELIAAEKEICAALKEAPEPPNVISLHPAILSRYEGQLQRLSATLGRTMDAGDSEAAEALRDLVEFVTITRTDEGQIAIDITGRLSALVGEETFPNKARRVWGGMMVRSLSELRLQTVSVPT